MFASLTVIVMVLDIVLLVSEMNAKNVMNLIYANIMTKRKFAKALLPQIGRAHV